MDTQTPYCFLILLVVFVSCAVQAKVSYVPEQVHIAIGEHPDQMVIVWNTGDATNESTVEFGCGGKPKQIAVGKSYKFVDHGSKKRVQYVHRVVLKGLAAQTECSYMVGSKLAMSDMLTFKTWPRGEKWSPRIALYGDMGLTNAKSLPSLQKETVKGMYDAILHVGDFAYDMHSDQARVGDKFMRQIEPVASRVPYMTCPGNHEEAYNFLNYKSRFFMPGDTGKRMYYSFTVGPVRFISLNTEAWYFPSSGARNIVEQYLWIEETLKEANKPENRAKHPWVIVFGHRPMYCSNSNHNDCTHKETLVRVGLPILHLLGWEKLLMQYGVDLAIWAHEHSYERLWPVYDRKVMNGTTKAPYTNPKAPVHVITGSAGCWERNASFVKNPEDWSAFRSPDYGYARMHVINGTHLHWEQISVDLSGKVIDSMTLIREKHEPYDSNPRDVTPKGDPLKKLWKTWGPFVTRARLHSGL